MTSSSHERRVLRLAVLIGAPGIVVTIALLWHGAYPARVQWTAGFLLVGLWLAGTLVLRERVIRPLQTLSNTLAAFREGDYSIRARGADRDDALGLALLESNLLGDTLRAQRLGALEATTLLRTVMEEIDVAVIACDEGERIRLVNRAGERLLNLPSERILGCTAEEVGLSAYLHGASPRTMDVSFPGGAGRWELRRGAFRLDGRPHMLVVLADVSKTLREEELLAWQRIVRVLGHEINNSLAPIKSIAGSLLSGLERVPRPPDTDSDLRRGLAIIAGRSEALERFMSAYARLARLPHPTRSPLDVGGWVHRVAVLETRLPVAVLGGPAATILADSDQLDQLLINIVRNAADAALETRGGVSLRWTRQGATIAVVVEDDGHGLVNRANLFVPFFTTKPNGSGIGLVLSRQIAEAHGGTLALENRVGPRGCIATIRLPVGA